MTMTEAIELVESAGGMVGSREPVPVESEATG